MMCLRYAVCHLQITVSQQWLPKVPELKRTSHSGKRAVEKGLKLVAKPCVTNTYGTISSSPQADYEVCQCPCSSSEFNTCDFLRSLWIYREGLPHSLERTV